MDESKKVPVYEDEGELREALADLRYTTAEEFLSVHRDVVDSLLPYDGIPSDGMERTLSVLPVGEGEDELLATALYHGLAQVRGTHRVANANIDLKKVDLAISPDRPDSYGAKEEVTRAIEAQLKEGRRFVVVDGLGSETTYVRVRGILRDAASGLPFEEGEILGLYCVVSGRGVLAVITHRKKGTTYQHHSSAYNG